MSLRSLHPVYVSLSCRNNSIVGAYDASTTADDATFYARATLETNTPIVDKMSDFICAVERMELSLNGVPFYDASNDVPGNRENIIISRRPAGVTTLVAVDLTAYSLSHLFEILNSYTYVDPNDNSEFGITFSISKDGFIVMSLLDAKTFTTLEVQIPRRLNMILGITTTQQIAGFSAAASSFPRVDMGDDLDHIVLQTNLPTVSDQTGNVRLNVLTDFAPPTNYSNSLSYGADGNLVRSSFSTNLRQKVIYTPSERRYLDLVGDFPLQNIVIDVFYVNQDEEIKRVVLPFGGSFELKLGLYLRQ